MPEDNDPMNMVRHYHKRIQPDTRVMIRQIRPAPAHHFRVPVLDHPAMRYPTEQALRCAVQTVTKYAPDDA